MRKSFNQLFYKEEWKNKTSTVCRNEKYAYKQKGMLLRTELEVSAW